MSESNLPEYKKLSVECLQRVLKDRQINGICYSLSMSLLQAKVSPLQTKVNPFKSPATLSTVEGNAIYVDGSSMYGRIPAALWKKWGPVDEKERIPMNCRCLLVEVDGKKILCETGMGNFFEPEKAMRYGAQSAGANQLLESLKELKVTPEQIDYVILTHLHFDHCQGTLPSFENPGGPLIFPNATYILSQGQYEVCQKPHRLERASFCTEFIEKLEAHKKFVLLNPDSPSPLEGVSFIFSHGHTKSLICPVFHFQSGKVAFPTDMIPAKPWVHLPVLSGFDRFAEKLLEEKKALMDQLQGQTDWIFLYHDWSCTAVQVQVNSKGNYEVAQEQAKWLRKTF